jgi:hypothetical protein
MVFSRLCSTPIAFAISDLHSIQQAVRSFIHVQHSHNAHRLFIHCAELINRC